MQVGGWPIGSLIQVCTGRQSLTSNAIVNEATASRAGGDGVLLSAGHLDAPHRFPGFIELCGWGTRRVVGGHSIPEIIRSPMLLGMGA